MTMEFDNLKLLLIGGQAVLFIFLLLLLYRSNKDRRFLTDELADTSLMLRKVKQKNSILENQLEQLKDFQNNLKEAELTTRLQTSRLNDTIGRSVADSPERYQYISSLDEKGMSSEEISTILNISLQETEQLLSLSRIAQKN